LVNNYRYEVEEYDDIHWKLVLVDFKVHIEELNVKVKSKNDN